MQPFFAKRFAKVEPSFIREILKVAVNPEVISFAGGLPNPAFSLTKSWKPPPPVCCATRATARCNTPPPRASGRCATILPPVTAPSTAWRWIPTTF
ncbi:hypothetical protein MBH78_09910 [Oceanimonas sp. NS1]|nr:hypothetical protein [Oceanimonas sp. NS1]